MLNTTPEPKDRLIVKVLLHSRGGDLMQEVIALPVRSYPKEMFSLAERKLVGEFKVEKRAHEWISGRVAAKEAIRLSSKRALPYERPPAYSEIIILPPKGEHTGPPQVNVVGFPRSVHTSISHAGGVAAAIAAMSTPMIGVDVEVIGPKDPSFPGEVFSRPELEELSGYISDEVRKVEIVVRFSIKEAILKALGIGFGLDLHQVRLHGAIEDGVVVHYAELTENAWASLTFGTGPGTGGFLVGHEVVHDMFGSGNSLVISSAAFIEEGQV